MAPNDLPGYPSEVAGRPGMSSIRSATSSYTAPIVESVYSSSWGLMSRTARVSFFDAPDAEFWLTSSFHSSVDGGSERWQSYYSIPLAGD